MSLKKIIVSIFLYFLLFFGYVIYAENTSDIRVSSDGGFYTLIAFVCFNILNSYFCILSKKPRFLFFHTMLFFWSLALYANSYKMLRLQIEWPDNVIVYSLYIVPILAFLSTSLFSNSKEERGILGVNADKLNSISLLLFFIAILIAIYEMKVTGIVPILMGNISESRLEYSLPFLHVVSEAFLKLSFFLSMFVLLFHNYKKSAFFIISGTIMYFLITFSRSGLMEIGVFSIVIIAFKKRNSFFTFSKKKIFFSLLLVFSFSILGAIRQGDDFNINEYTDSKVDNQVVNWFYGYYFVNIDNLALSLSEDSISYDYKRSLLFLSQILGTKPSQTDLNLYTYIGKLNLGTGFRDFSLDWGIYWGGLVLSILLYIYSLLMNLLKTNLFFLYNSLFITYIMLFPMVNRFSGFIPFFIFLSIFLFDFFLKRKKYDD
ncbi:O-antigen polymerase [Pectobacterium punjabense]|uniref:O-antigen polymerase n=1 Tax=Pectobacterium punjabense TaxID=2108399 RepID=UPI003D9B208C